MKKHYIYKTFILKFYLVTFLIFNSCSENSLLEIALKEAGSNRIELENLLNHYSRNPNDSLKYRAVVYLIENMKYHYAYSGEPIDNYYDEIRTLYCNSSINENGKVLKLEKLNDILKNNNATITKAMDIENITADLLISHIDASFKTREYPWAKNVSFEDFCEYVLPYRIANEPLQDWIPIYTHLVKGVADSIYKESNSTLEFVSGIVKYFSPQTQWLNQDHFPAIDLPPDLYFNIKYGTCHELSAWTLYSFKALGLPITWDFTPNWANRSLGHDWTSIVIDGIYYPFLFLDKCEFGEHISINPYEKPSKIFRKTYSIQGESLSMKKINEDIPELFKNPFLKDISDIYTDQYSDSCIDVTFELKYQFLIK